MLFAPFFHLQVSFTDFVIICGALEFNTEAIILFMIFHYHNIWMACHITFFPWIDSLFECILIFANPSNNNNLRITTPDKSTKVRRHKNEISEIMGFLRIFWKNNVQEAYLLKLSIWGQIVSEIVAQLCLQNSIQTLLNFFWVDPPKN